MKYLMVLMFAAGTVVGSSYYLNHHQKHADAQPVATASVDPASDPVALTSPSPVTKPIAVTRVEKTEPIAIAKSAPPAERTEMNHSAVAQAVDLLLSPQVSYEQKRAAWKQLHEGGGLEQAIGELQQRFTSNQACADCAAVLGHAYLQKCSTTSDVREQGILAMQADRLFDSALSLDAQNWEARFTKAVALSYWPSSMGKGQEVIDHFTTLIEQQEAQPQQPQFADSYVWLGDQYKKAGRPDDALSVWQRGAYLFPTEQKLADRLNSAP